MNAYILSSNALFLFVKITNSDSASRTASFSVLADVYFDGLDSASMATLASNSGFRIWSSQNEIRFVCRSYPLVQDVSSFWIGSFSSLTDNSLAQAAPGTVSGVDSAAAFSWQQIVIPAEGFVTRGVIVRFGRDEAAILTLSLTFPTVSLPFVPSDALEVTGTITDSRSAEGVRLLCVIDDDFSTLQSANLSLPSNSAVWFWLIPLSFGIEDIHHQISFYAVNSFGDVSLPQTVMFGGVLSAASISVLHSDDTGAIVGPIAAVTGVGLVGLIIVTLYIWTTRKANVQNEASP
jgi:hypothetical protein